MIKILYDEYKKHKVFVLTYVTICIVLAFVMGAFVPDFTGMHLKADTEGSVSAEDTLTNLNTRLLGNSLNELAGDYSDVVAISAEPFTGLFFLGVVTNINRLLDNPLNIPEIPLSHPMILAVIALCFVASKIMKLNSTTKVFGTCTLGYLEKFLGTVCILLIGILTVTGLSELGADFVVSAAEETIKAGSGAAVSAGVAAGSGAAVSAGVAAGNGSNIITGFLASFFSVFMAVMSLVVNFIIKTVVKAIDAIEILFSGIPFLTFLCECFKTGLAFFLCLINVIWPVAGYVLNVIVFICCCLLFKVSYNAARYFEQIYFFPFVRKIFKKRKDYPLVPKHMPRFLKKAMAERGMTPDFVIPVFVSSRHRHSSLKVKRFQKIYLIHSEDRTYLYFRKYLKQKNVFMDFAGTDSQEMFLKKGIMYYEIYNYLNTEKNMAKKYPSKQFSLVFAKNYIERIDDIIRMTGYTDITELQAKTRAEKKALRKQKRQETRDEFKEFVYGIFHKKQILKEEAKQ